MPIMRSSISSYKVQVYPFVHRLWALNHHVCDQICRHVQCIVFERMHRNKVLFTQVIDPFLHVVEVKGSLRRFHVASVNMRLWMVLQFKAWFVLDHITNPLSSHKTVHKTRLWTSFYSLYFW